MLSRACQGGDYDRERGRLHDWPRPQARRPCALLLAVLAGCAPRSMPAVEITTRGEWADAEPIAGRLTPHTPTYLTIHHAGVKDDGSVPGGEKMRRLYRFSVRDKPWGDVPYHYVIDRHGRVFEGRSLRFAPDTNTGYDVAGHVGICINGDLTAQPLEEVQYRSLVDLLVRLSAALNIPDDRIAGHLDHSPGRTSCPGVLEHYLRDGTLLSHLGAVRRGQTFAFERKPYDPEALE